MTVTDEVLTLHNLTESEYQKILAILKRETFDRTRIADGDEIEIVNFVGGG